jgi:hypothetical protein
MLSRKDRIKRYIFGGVGVNWEILLSRLSTLISHSMEMEFTLGFAAPQPVFV